MGDGSGRVQRYRRQQCYGSPVFFLVLAMQCATYARVTGAPGSVAMAPRGCPHAASG
jgi:hypothetical protein